MKSAPAEDARLLERLVRLGAGMPGTLEDLSPHIVIRTIRRGLRMTQAQLARRAGLPQSHLAKIETGKVDIQLSTLTRILKAMYCDAILIPKFLKTPQEALGERVKEVSASYASSIWDERGPAAARRGMPVRIVDKDEGLADLRFWLGKSPRERLDAVEFLREQYYALSGHKTLPRMARAVQMRKWDA